MQPPLPCRSLVWRWCRCYTALSTAKRGLESKGGSQRPVANVKGTREPGQRDLTSQSQDRLSIRKNKGTDCSAQLKSRILRDAQKRESGGKVSGWKLAADYVCKPGTDRRSLCSQPVTGGPVSVLMGVRTLDLSLGNAVVPVSGSSTHR